MFTVDNPDKFRSNIVDKLGYELFEKRQRI